jgi:hypothetical protein
MRSCPLAYYFIHDDLYPSTFESTLPQRISTCKSHSGALDTHHCNLSAANTWESHMDRPKLREASEVVGSKR